MLCCCHAAAQYPAYQWASGFIPADSSGCLPQKAVVDGSGNVYITGYFTGTVDFDPGPGIANLTSDNLNDIFVSKLDAGGAYVWAIHISGPSYNFGYGITVDGSGNVYITGSVWGPSGGNDIFVSKLDANGAYVWSKNMGGSGYDKGMAIAVDGKGNVYTTGSFSYAGDFDPGPGTASLTGVAEDIFVSKLDSNGNYVWAKRIGGWSNDIGLGITVDGKGNVYTTGFFSFAADFDPGPDTASLTGGDYEIFVSKLDTDGAYVWAKRMGGADMDIANAIALDDSGNIYTTGFFRGTADFDPGPGTANLTSSAFTDIFVSKLDAGGGYVWARRLAGSAPKNNGGRSIAVDGSGNVYTTGYFYTMVDADPGPATANLYGAGDIDVFASKLDVFVSKLDSNGAYVWAKSIGDTGNDVGHTIAVDGTGSVYTVGYFAGTVDFDPGRGTANLSAGNNGGFVVKWSQSALTESGVVSGQFVVYPNPTTGVIVLETRELTDDAILLITDVAGKVVRTKTIPKGALPITTIDLSGIAKGIYIVQVSMKEVTYRTKIVVR